MYPLLFHRGAPLLQLLSLPSCQEQPSFCNIACHCARGKAVSDSHLCSHSSERTSHTTYPITILPCAQKKNPMFLANGINGYLNGKKVSFVPYLITLKKILKHNHLRFFELHM